MAITQEPQVTSGETFTSTSPATGEVVGTFAVDGPEEVGAAVARARRAATWWAGLGADGRRRRLKAFKALIVQRSDELCELIHQENGKPLVDALVEVVLVADHLDWAARRAGKVLARRRVETTLLAKNHAAWVDYRPLGVVGVIGPWNYPLFTPMGSIGYALAAGNAVVFKPSELTPAVGRWLVDAFAEVVSEQPVLQLVTGFGATGNALCKSGVDKLAFTGSPPTGRKVMAACADTLTPVLLELGGKDVMIVDDDADVDAAAAAAVWGGCANAGQTCIGIERVYATAGVYDRFVAKAVELASGVHAGPEPDAAIGPVTMARQVEVIRRHLEDALARGARALVGGAESVHPPYVDPVVLVDVPEDALVMREETFGPVLPIIRVADGDEAVARANASGYGLASAVYGKRDAERLASALNAGMTSINAVQMVAAVPALPFGGVGESGFGRIHGAEGLREFARVKATTRLRFPLPFVLTSFQRPRSLIPMVKRSMRLRHGRG